MKGISKYMRQKVESIQKLLHNPPKNNSMVFYHKLRVEIKKLNAFLRLAEYSAPDFDRKKTRKPFLEIFRQAGKIRELQIGEALLKKHFPKTNFTTYRQHLREARKKEQQIFRNMPVDTLFAKQKKALKKARPFFEQISKKHAEAYLEKKRKSIRKLWEEKPVPPECLHDLRKQLKTYDYIQKGLHGQAPGAVTDETFLQLLGNWHDMETTLARLQKVTDLEGIHPKELALLEKVKTKLGVESDRAYEAIQTSISSFEG